MGALQRLLLGLAPSYHANGDTERPWPWSRHCTLSFFPAGSQFRLLINYAIITKTFGFPRSDASKYYCYIHAHTHTYRAHPVSRYLARSRSLLRSRTLTYRVRTLTLSLSICSAFSESNDESSSCSHREQLLDALDVHDGEKASPEGWSSRGRTCPRDMDEV